MKFNQVLNEYAKRYDVNDIKKLARSNAGNIEVINSSFRAEDGGIIKVLMDEVYRGNEIKYQLTFAKKSGNKWERIGQPIKSNDYQKLLKKAIETVESGNIKLKSASFATKLKSFLADYIGKPTRDLFKTKNQKKGQI